VHRCAYQPLKDGDEAALAVGKAFARESLFERLWLHAALELPAVLARSELFTAHHGARLVGLAAASDGLFPFRVAALDAALPGVAAELLQELAPPFVCRVPLRLAREVERAGARPIRRERQMVRFAPIADEVPLDPRIERLSDPGELTRFLGRDFAPLELELAPFLGIRDPFGELAAVAGARFLTERVALVAHIETREDCRRLGHARALVRALVRAVESPERHAVIHVREGAAPAERLLAELGFRGTHDFCLFAR
jgi:N-acetylglutamate synthase-like GNAT family acetyltransferase